MTDVFPSEPRNVGERHPTSMHVQAAQLGATMQLRKDLSGIEQSLGIKGAFHALLLIEIDLGEHRRHQVALLHADPMLAGQNAADLYAKLENFRAKFLLLFQLAWDIGILEYEPMHVAVSGIKHI